MSENSASLCIFCGVPNTTTNLSSDQEAIPKFLKQIGTQCPNLLSKSGKQPFCADCFSGVVKAVDLGEQLRDLEQDVRNLHDIVLKMTRQLRTIQDIYLDEMKRLEDKIRTLDLNVAGLRTNETATAIRKGVCGVVLELMACQQTRNEGPKITHKATASPLFVHSEKLSVTKPTLETTQQPHQESSRVTSSAYVPFESIDISTSLDFVAPVWFPGATKSLVKYPVQMSSIEALVENFAIPSQDQTSTNETPKHAGVSYTVSVSYSAVPDSSKFTWTIPLEYPTTLEDDPTISKNQNSSNNKRYPYKCAKCFKVFPRLASLQNHQNADRSNCNKPYLCSVCGKGFVHAEVYKAHRKLHKQEDIK